MSRPNKHLNVPSKPSNKNTAYSLNQDLNNFVPMNELEKLTAFLTKNKINDAEKKLSSLKKLYPNSPKLMQYEALICNTKSDFFGAVRAFKKVVSLEPQNPLHYTNLGLALENYGKIDDALENYANALKIDNKSHIAYHNMAVAFDKKGDLEKSIDCFKSALRIKPEFPVALNNLGSVLKKIGRSDEALSCFNLALKFNPDYQDASFNIFLIFKERNKFEEAINILNELISSYPGNLIYRLNLGLCLIEQRNFPEAADLLHEIIEEHPNCGEAFMALGSIERQRGNSPEAVRLFKLAILKNQNLEEAHGLLAVCYDEEGKTEEALSSYERGLEINPNSLSILNNFGHFHFNKKEFDKAFKKYLKAHQLYNPKTSMVSSLYYTAASMCDWVQTSVLEKKYMGVGAPNGESNPFIMLNFEDNPKNQHLRSIKHSQSYSHANKSSDLLEKTNSKSEKIKVGYFSADFHNHATMRLMSGLFKNHDKSKFSIHTFMYGNSPHDEQTKIVIDESDEFFDISKMNDKSVVELVRQQKLDIAIDLKGYTKDTRSQLFSYRLAPIQINYLGFPSTMGADFMDYIVADKVLIPDELQENYSEKIIYMPHTYQPNDDKREIANTGLTREILGLGDDAFVMCCLNNNYKITRHEFEIWLRILEKIDNSFLVFLATNKFAVKNIYDAAEKRGLSKNRIIFVPQVAHEVHLERLALFDLFLDTFRINAHTTASDALWAGLPVITKMGQQFAARVASSLLKSLDLEELITETAEDYEKLITDLAVNKNRLSLIKAKLKFNRNNSPLFDTLNYTRNFEKCLVEAYVSYNENRVIDNIEIT